MLAEIALAALLDSASVQTPARPETVYVERVMAPTLSEPKKDRTTQYLLGGIMTAAGAYLVIHGRNNPTKELELDDYGRPFVSEKTNSQVYIGFGCMGVAMLTFAL